MKYNCGNIGNIGDDIQSIAAKRFVPRVDYHIFREKLNFFRADTLEKIKIILNGWFMPEPQNFPPSEVISPLLVSVHFCDAMKDYIINNNSYRNYLIKHGPVGCRDKATLKFLLDNNIPSYFSGCMTLTLKGNEKIKSSSYVLCVDVSDNVFNYVKKNSDKPVYRISKSMNNPFLEAEKRLETAKIFLYLYHNASAVITTNLHTALPCLAFNTPVCLIDQKNYDGRFDGPDEWLNHCSESEFINGKFYDINNPPDNSREFMKYRDLLIETCKNFTGFDSNAPIFDDDYKPELNILDILNFDNDKQKQDVLHNMSGKILLKIAGIKLFRKIFRK